MAVPTLTATDRHRPPSVALFGSLSTAYGQLFGLRKKEKKRKYKLFTACTTLPRWLFGDPPQAHPATVPPLIVLFFPTPQVPSARASQGGLFEFQLRQLQGGHRSWLRLRMQSPPPKSHLHHHRIRFYRPPARAPPRLIVPPVS